jgi:DNA-binding NtrC family response regulator
LRGISGLDLQHELAGGDAQIPIIFMTGYGDIPMTVRAMIRRPMKKNFSHGDRKDHEDFQKAGNG